MGLEFVGEVSGEGMAAKLRSAEAGGALDVALGAAPSAALGAASGASLGAASRASPNAGGAALDGAAGVALDDAPSKVLGMETWEFIEIEEGGLIGST